MREVVLVRQLDKNDKRFLRDLEAMPARHIFISRTERMSDWISDLHTERCSCVSGKMRGDLDNIVVAATEAHGLRFK